MGTPLNGNFLNKFIDSAASVAEQGTIAAVAYFASQTRSITVLQGNGFTPKEIALVSFFNASLIATINSTWSLISTKSFNLQFATNFLTLAGAAFLTSPLRKEIHLYTFVQIAGLNLVTKLAIYFLKSAFSYATNPKPPSNPPINKDGDQPNPNPTLVPEHPKDPTPSPTPDLVLTPSSTTPPDSNPSSGSSSGSSSAQPAAPDSTQDQLPKSRLAAHNTSRTSSKSTTQSPSQRQSRPLPSRSNASSSDNKQTNTSSRPTQPTAPKLTSPQSSKTTSAASSSSGTSSHSSAKPTSKPQKSLATSITPTPPTSSTQTAASLSTLLPPNPRDASKELSKPYSEPSNAALSTSTNPLLDLPPPPPPLTSDTLTILPALPKTPISSVPIPQEEKKQSETSPIIAVSADKPSTSAPTLVVSSDPETKEEEVATRSEPKIRKANSRRFTKTLKHEEVAEFKKLFEQKQEAQKDISIKTNYGVINLPKLVDMIGQFELIADDSKLPLIYKITSKSAAEAFNTIFKTTKADSKVFQSTLTQAFNAVEYLLDGPDYSSFKLEFTFDVNNPGQSKVIVFKSGKKLNELSLMIEEQVAPTKNDKSGKLNSFDDLSKFKFLICTLNGQPYSNKNLKELHLNAHPKRDAIQKKEIFDFIKQHNEVHFNNKTNTAIKIKIDSDLLKIIMEDDKKILTIATDGSEAPAETISVKMSKHTYLHFPLAYYDTNVAELILGKKTHQLNKDSLNSLIKSIGFDETQQLLRIVTEKVASYIGTIEKLPDFEDGVILEKIVISKESSQDFRLNIKVVDAEEVSIQIPTVALKAVE